MNEHDSERIAGLLTADGYVPTEEAAEANVVVFNTCAIRENADNRLYGNLGHLRPLKAGEPADADRRRRVPGAEGRRHDPGAGPVGRRRRRHPRPARACSSCSIAPRPRARRSTSASRPRSSRAPCRPGARSRTTRGSRSRSGATTRARSASCRSSAGRSVSRPIGDVLAEVQGLARRRRRRGDAARPEREHVRPGPHRARARRGDRCSPTCSAR